MENNMENGMQGQLCLPLCRRVINTDISEDIVLPDYIPQVRRVLSVRENLLPPSKFIGGNKLDVSGVVDYDMVYISNEGKLCTAPLSAEYSFSLPLENAADFDFGEGVSIVAQSICESASVRPTSPRKLQLRSRLRTDVAAYAKLAERELFSGVTAPEAIRQDREAAMCAELLSESADVITLSDEYILPDPECRVALAQGRVIVESCRGEGELIRIGGKLNVELLLMCDGESRCERVVRSLPFEAECELDGVDMGEGISPCARGHITELQLNEEEGRIAMEASIVVSVICGGNKSVGYIRDAYSKAQRSECSYVKMQLPHMISNKSYTFSQNERIEIGEDAIPLSAEIISICGGASVGEAAVENDKYVFRGETKYSIIYKSEGEYGAFDTVLPFRYETDTEEAPAYSHMSAELTESRARLEGEVLSIDSELCLQALIMGESDISCVESAAFGEATEGSAGGWRVCYLHPNNTLWDVAKRYSADPEQIQGNIETDRFLIIEG